MPYGVPQHTSDYLRNSSGISLCSLQSALPHLSSATSPLIALRGSAAQSAHLAPGCCG